MADRVVLDLGYYSKAKNNIINEATKLFALKGFGAVSTRDIAKAVGMNIASVYYYYESKEALLTDIFSNVEKGFRHYYEWLIDESKKADSPEKLLDVIYNKELLEMADPMVCLGISLAIKEQHNNAIARRLVVELFTDYSISSMQAGFDGLVEKGVIRSFETKALSTLLVLSAMAVNDLRLHEFTGEKTSIDFMEMYASTKRYVLSTLQYSTEKHQESAS